MHKSLSLPAFAVLLAAPSAFAQNQVQNQSQEPAQLAPVVVTAPLPSDQTDMTTGTTVLAGDDLDRQRGATLGETLRHTPGVAGSDFGPGASRPIIRGQGGPRVRVMRDGLDAFDAASVSPDHAVAVPMDSARRIEVLRGPASLLYGSSAIAGVVNVIDGRIPDALPRNGTSGETRLNYGSADKRKTGFASIDTAVTNNVVLHGEAGALDAEDYSIGGYASATQREAGVKNTVPNTAMKGRDGAVGASFLGDGGYGGLSLARMNSYYGVPGADPVRIDMHQTRLDGKFGLYDPLPGLHELRGKLGYADYKHDEIEQTGEIGTRFNLDNWEGRLEALHEPIAGIEGVFGFQGGRRDFTAIGEEAYLPQNTTDSYAVFLLERYELGDWQFSLGGRLEYTEIDVPAQNTGRDFTTLSYSGGVNYRINPAWTAGVSLSHTQRAPTAEELYSNGEHVATNSFEIGNARLNKESAWHAEAGLRKVQGDVTGSASVYATRYSDYIYGAFTGAQQNGVDERLYSQTGADFRGMEFEIAWTFLRGDGYTLSADGLLDFVRAEDRDNGRPLPLTPPMRYGLGLTGTYDAIRLRLEMLGAAKQDRVGANETSTEGYTLFNAALTWRPLQAYKDFILSLEGRNLSDAEARSHTSLLKAEAPLLGREVRLGSAVKF
ncbi:TonB-dependent receptor [Ferrovibrio sp.]|uniref:TonB-dependent receptor n=1 Tax=Ferrovibrio sp. TaxID=1917215 RepID=UPI0025BB697E|nr:TonB-dependent receptor [Ferrovibrio sp.]MBX3455588.1 TonB-dependent receptor [Ferrovibrio sp.]